MTTAVPAVDLASGMLVYATDAPGATGRIRATRDDFQVDEIFDIGQIEPERKEGYVPIYSLTKSGLDTPHAARELGERLRSAVNFAGMKDSAAVTSQYVSARSSRADDPEVVRGRGFEARRAGYLPRPVSKGMISGNSFRVVVRTGENVSDSVDAIFRLCSSRRIPNFFGYQRFGLKSLVNPRVGHAVLLRDFKSAIETFVGEPRRGEDPEAAEARNLFRDGRYRESQNLFSPHRQDIERKVATRLAEKQGDYFGAFRRVPILVRRLFVQSFQSYLFNVTLSRAVADGLDISSAQTGDNWTVMSSDGLRGTRVHGAREPIPQDQTVLPLVQLVGYAFRDYGSRFDRIILRALADEGEGLTPASFYVKEADEVSTEGGFRQAPLLATRMGQAVVEGGVMLSFSLGRGEYATTLLRELLKPQDPLLSGF